MCSVDLDHVAMQWVRVDDYIFLGSNLCCDMHAQKLYAEDIQVEIDLQVVPQHALSVSSVLWIPTPDGEAPTVDQLFTATGVLTDAVERQQAVYVHCRHGHGRAPTVVAAYYITRGQTVNEAVAFVASQRPEIHIGAAQRQQLEAFARAHRKAT